MIHHAQNCASEIWKCDCGAADVQEELERLRGIVVSVERAIECAETVLFETPSRSDFKIPMVPASDLRDILDGKIS